MTNQSPSRFDVVVPRRGTNSYKWDSTLGDYKDLLPMWIADMDFQAAPAILEALAARVNHGIFGYTRITESVFRVYQEWVRVRQGVELPAEWMLYTQGVLAALATAVQTLSAPGDRVIIQPPVYYPFESLIAHNGREVGLNPLVERNGKWCIDLDHLERVASEGARILLLCSPHNPVGRVWTRAELDGVLEVCQRHSLIVISDEIHSDIIMPGHEHCPLFSLGENKGVDVVALTSPTKTFNLAGVPMAWMIAPRRETRTALKRALSAAHTGSANVMSVAAAETAYRDCGDWLDELIPYLMDNRNALEDGLSGHVPGLRIAPLEGTYLAWLDFRGVAIDWPSLNGALLEKAELRLNDGSMFGAGGAGFQRLNLAAPRSLVLDAVDRIRRIFG